MSKVPEDAVNSAQMSLQTWKSLVSENEQTQRQVVYDMLALAFPEIREQVAQEIEARKPKFPEHEDDWMIHRTIENERMVVDHCADVARKGID